MFSFVGSDGWLSTKTNPYDEVGGFVKSILWQRNQEVESLPELKIDKHSHYKKDVSYLDSIDVYRVLDLFNVKSHAIGHAVKKLLCSGQRGVKDQKQDIQEAIDSLERELEMIQENES